jgi:putative ABC transport system permease protein
MDPGGRMSVLTDLLERLRLFVFRRSEERDLDEELHFHLAMETEKNERLGLANAEARRRGIVALGRIEQTKESVRDARGIRLLEDTLGDLRLALRALRRSPGFAIVATLTLAVGIGGTTAVFSAVNAVLLRPLPYEQPGQLVRLYQYYGSTPWDGFVTPVHYLAFRERFASLERVAAINNYAPTNADIGGSDGPRRIRLLPVSAEYFDVLRVSPAIGRGFRADEEDGAPVVVLSHELWKAQFAGDVSVVGRPFIMSGTPFTVVGVMRRGFTDPIGGSIDAWIPVDLTSGRDPSNATNHGLAVVGRLRPATPLSSAQSELRALDAVLARTYPDAKDLHAQIHPLKEDIVRPASRSLSLMLGAVTLVLLLVCVNIANLLLVRGSERAREFALRSSLGAPRSRLVRQLLVESAALAIAGSIAGLVVARMAMSAIVVLSAGSIPRLSTLPLEPRLLVFAIGVASLSVIAFGLAPALRTTRVQPSDVLREQARSTTGSRAQGRVREALVVSQVALAFVMLVGASLLIASFQRLQRVSLGVTTDRVFTFELFLPPARYDSTARARFYEDFAATAMQIPGVVAAGGVSRLPATGEFHSWTTRPQSGPLAGTGQARDFPSQEQRIVSGAYFRAVGIQVLEGRVFDARDDAAAPHRAVISRTAATALFPGVDPLGQRLRTGGRELEVIGVVSDVAVDVQGQLTPTVYHAHTQFAGDRNWELRQVIATTGSPSALAREVRLALAAIDPRLVMYRPAMLASVIGEGTATRVFTLRLLTTFAVLALGLAALGLFGVLSYAVKLRSREFGIRMALGANRGAIRVMVLRRGLGVAGVGVGIGLLGAFALSKVMAAMVFRVSPLDPVVLAGSIVFMGLVAAFAALAPAYRATAVDPRTVLQGE